MSGGRLQSALAFADALRAEVAKQHQGRTRGRMVAFSLLLWPALAFLTSYYTMQPYRSGEGSALSRAIPEGGVPLFLLTGYLVFQLYWTSVQSAWLFEQERREGTLESVFLAPSSKLAFLYGRSLYALLHGIWMFLVFSALAAGWLAGGQSIRWEALLPALLLLLLSSVIWGALLSAVSLFSRDSGYLYYIFQAPMELFGGVRIPVSVFPPWASALSLLFPVTYSLILVRGAVYDDIGFYWYASLAALIAGCLTMAALTALLLSAAERHARSKGSWNLF